MLTDAQLAILDVLIYCKQFRTEEYREWKLGDLLSIIPSDPAPAMVSAAEFEQIKQAALADPEICRLRIESVNPDTNAGNHMAYFVDPQDPNGKYVIFAGTAAHEWGFDVQGAKEPDPPNKIATLEWFDSLNLSYPVVVSGHSDGGNDAMYITVRRGDLIRRCVPIDAQGFGKPFMELYGDEIIRFHDRIVAYNHYADFVSPLLNPIAGGTHYIDGYSTGIAHIPSEIFAHDSDGNLILPLQFGHEAVRHPLMNLLQKFSTEYLENNISDVEVAWLSYIVENLMDGTWDANDVLAIVSARAGAPLFLTKHSVLGTMAFLLPNRSTSGRDRDFRRAKIDELRYLCKAGDEKLCPLSDMIGDVWLSLNLPDVEGLLKLSTDKYRALFDKNDWSLQKFDEVIEKVYSIDATYQEKFSGHLESVQAITDELKQCRDSATPNQVHVVVPGDTLWDISIANGISLGDVIRANPDIKNPDLIYPGDNVVLPGYAGSFN
jgi:hypothetical protein